MLSSQSTFQNLSKNPEIMPMLFVGHGSPMNAIEENEFVAGWREIGKKLPKPEAVLCISAHWETHGVQVTAMEKPRTIHDFGGFPKALFEVKYPAPGSPLLAIATKNLVQSAVIALDHHWGLDHGCWSVLKHLYPNADVPVFQMSLDINRNPQGHFNLANELFELRKKGVLIIGSGNMVHNLRMIDWQKMYEPEFGFDWAISASNQMNGFIANRHFDSLVNYRQLGREFQLAVPSPDHFIPLLYVLGLTGLQEKITFFNDKPVMGSITMTSLLIEAD